MGIEDRRPDDHHSYKKPREETHAYNPRARKVETRRFQDLNCQSCLVSSSHRSPGSERPYIESRT